MDGVEGPDATRRTGQLSALNAIPLVEHGGWIQGGRCVRRPPRRRWPSPFPPRVAETLQRLSTELDAADAAKPGTWFSSDGFLSANGHYVAYNFARRIDEEPYIVDSRTVVRDLRDGSERVTLRPVKQLDNWTVRGLTDDGSLLIYTAKSLVPEDTDVSYDIYLWNTADDTMAPVSVGSPAVPETNSPMTVDPSGRYVVWAGNSGADREFRCNYQHFDALTGVTTTVPKAADTTRPTSCGDVLRLSGNGQVVVFGSSLMPEPETTIWDAASGAALIKSERGPNGIGGLDWAGQSVLLTVHKKLVRYDRATGEFAELASSSPDVSDSYPYPISPSPDLRWTLIGTASRLFSGDDTDIDTDTFRVDTTTGRAERISLDVQGEQNGGASPVALSSDGALAMLSSVSRNGKQLMPADPKVRGYLYLRHLAEFPAAPYLQIDSGPASGDTVGPRNTVAFSGGEAMVGAQCRHADLEWQPCTSPHTFQLSGSPNTMWIRSYGARGVLGETERIDVDVDASAPNTSISGTPAALTRNAGFPLGFSSPEAGATFECRVDEAAWQACASPWKAPLTSGKRTLAVRALDSVGNADASPATHVVTLDQREPSSRFTTAPSSPTKDRTPSFAFAADESGSTFACSVDNKAWATCGASWTAPTLPDGAHTLRVRATDPAGNVETSPASKSFTVDSKAPSTTISSKPASTGKDRTPSFKFTSNESSATFECSMDGKKWATCGKSWTSPSVKPGKHKLEVRAKDKAGNVDASPASFAFRVS